MDISNDILRNMLITLQVQHTKENQIVLDVHKILTMYIKFINKLVKVYVNDIFPVDPDFKSFLKVGENLFEAASFREVLLPVLDFYLEIILDPSTDFWTAYELVNSLNSIFSFMKSDTKNRFFDEHSFNIFKLMDLLCICGDYGMQESILKLIFGIMPFEKGKELTIMFFPEDPHMQEQFFLLVCGHFQLCSRAFLNLLNSKNKIIYSIIATSLSTDVMELLPPKFYGQTKEVWIDFNKRTESVSFQCVNTNDDNETIFIYKNIIKKIHFNSTNKSFNLIFYLSDKLPSILPSSKLYDCLLIKMTFKCSKCQQELVEKYLPNIFGELFTGDTDFPSEVDQFRSLKADGLSVNPLSLRVCSRAASSDTSISSKDTDFPTKVDQFRSLNANGLGVNPLSLRVCSRAASNDTSISTKSLAIIIEEPDGTSDDNLVYTKVITRKDDRSNLDKTTPAKRQHNELAQKVDLLVKEQIIDAMDKIRRNFNNLENIKIQEPSIVNSVSITKTKTSRRNITISTMRSISEANESIFSDELDGVDTCSNNTDHTIEFNSSFLKSYSMNLLISKDPKSTNVSFEPSMDNVVKQTIVNSSNAFEGTNNQQVYSDIEELVEVQSTPGLVVQKKHLQIDLNCKKKIDVTAFRLSPDLDCLETSGNVIVSKDVSKNLIKMINFISNNTIKKTEHEKKLIKDMINNREKSTKTFNFQGNMNNALVKKENFKPIVDQDSDVKNRDIFDLLKCNQLQEELVHTPKNAKSEINPTTKSNKNKETFDKDKLSTKKSFLKNSESEEQSLNFADDVPNELFVKIPRNSMIDSICAELIKDTVSTTSKICAFSKSPKKHSSKRYKKLKVIESDSDSNCNSIINPMRLASNRIKRKSVLIDTDEELDNVSTKLVSNKVKYVKMSRQLARNVTDDIQNCKENTSKYSPADNCVGTKRELRVKLVNMSETVKEIMNREIQMNRAKITPLFEHVIINGKEIIPQLECSIKDNEMPHFEPVIINGRLFDYDNMQQNSFETLSADSSIDQVEVNNNVNTLPPLKTTTLNSPNKATKIDSDSRLLSCLDTLLEIPQSTHFMEIERNQDDIELSQSTVSSDENVQYTDLIVEADVHAEDPHSSDDNCDIDTSLRCYKVAKNYIEILNGVPNNNYSTTTKKSKLEKISANKRENLLSSQSKPNVVKGKRTLYNPLSYAHLEDRELDNNNEKLITGRSDSKLDASNTTTIELLEDSNSGNSDQMTADEILVEIFKKRPSYFSFQQHLSHIKRPNKEQKQDHNKKCFKRGKSNLKMYEITNESSKLHGANTTSRSVAVDNCTTADIVFKQIYEKMELLHNKILPISTSPDVFPVSGPSKCETDITNPRVSSFDYSDTRMNIDDDVDGEKSVSRRISVDDKFEEMELLCSNKKTSKSPTTSYKQVKILQNIKLKSRPDNSIE